MTSASILNRKGADLWLQGDVDGARAYYLATLQLDPNYVPALANLGVILAGENKLKAAEAIFRRAACISPDDGRHWDNLGNVLTRQELFGDAAQAFEQAEKLIPDSPSFWHNKALLLYRIHSHKAALRCLEKVEALGGLSLAVENDVAHVLLALGNLDSALLKYEARWDTLSHLQPWDFHIPEWRGEDLAGKHILFHAEQGFGDTIMTARFAEELQNRGARVTFGLPPGLIKLFEFQGWDCVNIAEFSESCAKEFDFQSPMYSAMRWLGIQKDNIKPDPYIAAPDIVGPQVDTRFVNVGICWASGKRGGQHDWRRRHAPLEHWLKLLSFPKIQLWSLQKGEESDDIIRLGAESLIRDMTNRFEDWADTAAFIAQLDLVISVDTAVVHLAGAMGKPVWMLSQFTNCWRWWEIENCCGLPWYRDLVIFPQESPQTWEQQLDQVYNRLGGQFNV